MTADQLREFDLLPCPFCGAKPTSQWIGDEDGGYWEVSCNKCLPKDSSLMVTQFIGVHGHFEEECIQAWNTRPTAVASHAEGEVVAWRWRDDVRPGLPWKTTTEADVIDQLRTKGGYEIEPLFAHPPRSGDEARDAARWRKFLSMVDPDKVPGGFTLYFAIEEGTDQLCYADNDITEIVEAAMAARGEGQI